MKIADRPYSLNEQVTDLKKSFLTFSFVAILTCLAKLAIVGKELVVAARYGRSDQVDALLIAALVPAFVGTLLGNAMNTAFIPVYIQCAQKEGTQAANDLLAGMSFLNICTTVILALLIGLSAPYFLPWIASGFDRPKTGLTFHLLVILVPYVFLSGISSMWSAVLNAHERFAIVVLTPVISPLVMVSGLFIFPAGGIRVLADGMVAGTLIEIIVLGIAIRTMGISWWPGWKGWSDPLQRVIRQFIPAVTGSLLMGSAILIDQAMASGLAPGSVAALSYGSKFIGFLLAIVTTTLTTILTPYFSKKAVGEGQEELFTFLRRFLRFFPLIFLLPLAITLFSEPIVRLIYYRGAFGRRDVQLVAGVQSRLAWQIPFYISSVILARVIAALQQNRIIPYIAACNVMLNIVLNYILMKRMGVEGIALSTSIVYMTSFLWLLIYIYQVQKKA
jgi:putative peptidoglycan lipid II flippase